MNTEVGVKKYGPNQNEFNEKYLGNLGQDVQEMTLMNEFFFENGELTQIFQDALSKGSSASFALPIGQREFEGKNGEILRKIFARDAELIEQYQGRLTGTGVANWYDGSIPTATELESARTAIESMGSLEHVTPVLLNGAVLQDYLKQTTEGHNLIGTGKGRTMKIATLVDIARVMKQSGATSPSELNHAMVWHDTDIRGFDKLDVVRGLAAAIFDGCDFAKASFTRAKEDGKRLYGRVTNVIAIPFIKSLQKIAQDNDNNLLALEILGQFRYPCSGEVALTPRLALDLKIPNDFGIEAHNLTEVAGLTAAGQVVAGDVFLGPYDHFHSTQESLGKMAEEVLTGFMQALIDQEYFIGANEKEALILETLRNMMIAIRDRKEKSERFNLQDVVGSDLEQAILFVDALTRVSKKIKHLEASTRIKPLSALFKTLSPGSFNFSDFYDAATDEQNWNKTHFVNLKEEESRKKD